MKHHERTDEGHAHDLSQIDAQWERIAPRVEEPEFQSHNQRRLGERVPLRATAIVVGAHGSFIAQTLDLSCSGCALMADIPESVNEAIILLRTGTVGPSLALEARRTRSFSKGTAFEFTNITDIDRLSLGEFLDRVVGEATSNGDANGPVTALRAPARSTADVVPLSRLGT